MNIGGLHFRFTGFDANRDAAIFRIVSDPRALEACCKIKSIIDAVHEEPDDKKKEEIRIGMLQAYADYGKTSKRETI